MAQESIRGEQKQRVCVSEGVTGIFTFQYPLIGFAEPHDDFPVAVHQDFSSLAEIDVLRSRQRLNLEKLVGTHFFPHRALAAFAEIWERFLGLSFAALAAPPLSPPRRPSATAWGFLDA